MAVIGIDYSLSSPAICVSEDEECTFDKCKFFYLTNKNKYDTTIANKFYGQLHKPWNTPEERYHNISSWAMKIINEYEPSHITIEDYAFGAKGRVFHIGENMGVLRYRIYRGKYNYAVISPSEVKKFATQKGNAKKELMYEKFYEEHKYNMIKDFNQTTLDNPVTDIIDSYYICKVGICLLQS
tara:strand:+ start:14914 stop:15462 length:549 start_codon:yes stop_codon:yes gene_type:complete